MDIKEAYLITFSPTHTSKQVGEAIVRGTGIASQVIVDATLKSAGCRKIPSTALVVFTVPVYGGHVAPLALERLKEIRSDGAPAVVVVVYGNRAYEKALTELDSYVTGLGFKVISGATFIGEHSYSSKLHPIASGRPDADDLAFAELYGQKIRTKITEAADSEKLYAVDVRRIQRPGQPFFPLLRFLHRVIKLRKSGIPLPRTPKVDKEHCTNCGWCANHCPTGAIVKGEENETQAEKCIKCCACVKGCPQKARIYDTPFASLLADCFKKPKENRIIL